MTLRLFPTRAHKWWFLVTLCLSVTLVVGSIMEIKRNDHRLCTTSILGSVLSFVLSSGTLVATTCHMRPLRPLNSESPILMVEKLRYRPSFAVYNHRGTVMHMSRYGDVPESTL
ncbi:hypothetical protein GpartN1_g5845.t1 [Galdieria partita]|uniref:Uncharacterized protein n=1 Tax=Galdieria partita TaxID=83374 RepID=A0A9C7Q0M6_9RHOD|nr:hypothetical protein GpartN1_g5845.t1 [Galdieria partita]